MLSIGVCALCGKTEELLKRSHIIPDFMYAEVYDQDHRLNLFSPARMVRGEGDVRRPPTAPYDGGILCRNCDSVLLNGYEDYASRLLFGKGLPPSIAPRLQNFEDPENGFGESKISNVHYDKFKLFILSILWRSHQSSQPFFRDVNLGSHAEVIKAHLLSGVAPDEDTYPVFILGWTRESTFPKDFVVQPVSFKWHKMHYSYVLMFRGLILMIFVSPNADTSSLNQHKLKSDGTMSILTLPSQAVKEFFSKICGINPRILKGLG